MKYRSILEINHLDAAERIRVYRQLIPGKIYQIFAIDPVSFRNCRGEKVVQFQTTQRHGFVSIDVKRRMSDRDPIFLLQLSDTPFFEQLELSFIAIHDVRAQRFHIDRDEEGRDTLLGTASRNLAEEKRAMDAGLAPGQIYPGLRLFRPFLQQLEEFASQIGCSMISAEALFYHNAIHYEQLGFGYLEGRRKMEEIHREFQPGGILYARLDGSTPFRPKGAERSVRGRSWAIHDGICETPWIAPRMYKPVGRKIGVNTFPNQIF
jgi:hypothetical protein